MAFDKSSFVFSRATFFIVRSIDTTSEDEKQIYFDYLIGLRMLILIIKKINDELCNVEK